VSTGYPILVLSLQVMLALPLLRQFGRFLIDARELCSPKTVVAGSFVGLYLASYYFTSDHDRDAFMTIDGYFNLLLLAVLAEYAVWAGVVLGCAAAADRHGSCRPCRLHREVRRLSGLLWCAPRRRRHLGPYLGLSL
jgi:hypothetical protein